jgi:hypothetical protein
MGTRTLIALAFLLVVPTLATSEEPLDSFEDFRMRHLVRTAEVWRRLQAHGAIEETPLNFDFSFDAPSESAVSALKADLSDYELDVAKHRSPIDGWTVSGESGAITWTEELLLKWIDYLIVVGRDAGAEFNGCGASAP